MGQKGISWIEANAEKIFAGLFGVGLLGVLAWQFVGPPTTVKVGNRDGVPLEGAFEAVASEAKIVRGKIEALEVEKPEGADQIVASFAGVADRLSGPVAPRPQLAAGLGGGTTVATGDLPTGGEAAKLGPVVVPTTDRPVAAVHLATIDPSELGETGLRSFAPADGPADMAIVSVEAAFSGTALRESLSRDPDGDGPLRAIPKHWWDPDTQILFVELERETLQADGSWSESTKVPVTPGREPAQNAAVFAEVVTPQGLRQVVERARTDAAEVRRPSFYRVFAGPAWSPPKEALAAAADGAAPAGGGQAELLRREAAQIEARIKNIEAEIARLQRGPGPGRPPGGPGGGPGGEREPPPPPGGRGGGPGAGGRESPEESRRKQLDASLAQQQQRLQQINDRIARLEQPAGGGPGGDGGPGGPGEGNPPPGDERGGPGTPGTPGRPATAEPPLLSSESVTVWAHDPTVQRGKTYRYRTVVVVNNPMFGQGAVMSAEQGELSRTPLVRSAPSEWSEPIEVDGQTYFFFTGASDEDGALGVGGRATARAELFEFRWGYWRRAQVSAEPGDLLVGSAKAPDLTAAFEAAKQAAAGGAGGDGRPGGGAGGPGGQGGQGGPGGPGGEKPPAAAMTDVTINAGALVLGVATGVPTQDGPRGRGAVKVFVREPGGAVVARSPEADRESEAFRRMTRSAAAGEQAPVAAVDAGGPGAGDRDERARGPETRPPTGRPSGGG